MYGSFEAERSLLISPPPSEAKRRDHEWTEHLDGFSTYHSHATLSKDGPMAIIWDIFEAPLLLILVGVASALMSFAIGKVTNFGSFYRWQLISAPDDYYSWAAYCAWCVSFSLLACFLSQSICREAAGSGLPEMKTILSGVIKPVLLSYRLIMAKLIGVALAIIAGLSVGKEGPYVQVSGAMADQLMKLPVFQHIQRQDAKRLEMIACACASGVSATFGTAFGGVLFSIEFTSSAYLVRTLPKAFLTSVCAMLAIYSLGSADQLALFNDQIQSKKVQPEWCELLAFVGIGLLCGLLGVLFVSIVEVISTYRNQLFDLSKYTRQVVDRRRYCMVGVVSLVISIAMYYELSSIPLGTGANAQHRTVSDILFHQDDSFKNMNQLLPYFVYKFFATALSVTLPLPVGLFTPVFFTGGVLGRIIGEQLCTSALFSNYAPWEYSILGAAGLATGVTRAISTAVIVYELAGQPHMRLPLSVVVITAYFVGNRFSKNVYEVLIDTNGTPYMQEVPKALYNVPVADVMLPVNENHVLSLESTYSDVGALLSAIHAGEVSALGSYSDSSNMLSDGLAIKPQADALPEDCEQNKHSLHMFSPQIAGAADANVLLSPTPQLASSGWQVIVEMRHYSPSVVPIVKSKRSMVIVGAVMRNDLEHAMRKIRDLAVIAHRQPVVLGRFDDEDEEEGMMHEVSAECKHHVDDTPLHMHGTHHRSESSVLAQVSSLPIVRSFTDHVCAESAVHLGERWRTDHHPCGSAFLSPNSCRNRDFAASCGAHRSLSLSDGG